MSEKRLSEKIIVLGIDGMDPMLTKKFVDQGIMPNLQQFIAGGSAREDLMLLGAMPTVTPPMWTTLATGAYPATHGITAFFNQHPEKLDTMIYALDSRMCKAEQVWNVFAENGRNTLVWHWPGSSWPPSSPSKHLAVVDGTQPGAVNMGVATVDWETVGMASEAVEELRYLAHNAPQNAGTGCVITGLENTVANESDADFTGAQLLDMILNGLESKYILLDENDGEVSLLGSINVDIVNSPIKIAVGWANAPEGAKEFYLLTSQGYVRRPVLILKNAQGIYDRVAIYKSKKDSTPLIEVMADTFTTHYIDEVQKEGVSILANRNLRILELAEDGSQLRFWLSPAYDMGNDSVWHPKELHEDIVNNVGIIPPITNISGKNMEYVEKIIIPTWDNYSQWQADCLNYLMSQGSYDIIFSHLHNVDLIGHQTWHFGKHREEWGNDATFYQNMFAEVYKQTDRYLGQFLKYLDQGWTVIITSDHGLLTEENRTPILGEGGVNVKVMQELGYTEVLRDKNGKMLREIDWTKTKAIATRSGHIYLNLIGRNPQGIVRPEEKYELEAEIISALYGYRDHHTNKRVVSLALRNKDAILLGMSGSGCGDIIFFMEEGYNIIHADSLSTQQGYFDTSVSPIFVAAGAGIKKNHLTDRVIRQVDVAPTIAALGGVRMPAQCEGAIVHQILTDIV